jgi:membrane fusion protein (multidrug efflux system)
MEVVSAPLPIINELPGRIDAVRIAEVRARVPGILLKQLFKEGADVKAGEVLFQIDPAPLQATLNSAKANLARADAGLKQAEAKANRYKSLVEVNAVSKQSYDDATAAVLQGQAEVQAAQAAVEAADLNLGYATVTAPIAGRIGKAMMTEGALVGQGATTLLAVIQQLDPIYFDFTQSSTELLRLRRALESGSLKSAAAGEARVTLLLEDGSVYPQAGRLLFSDISVDPTTGMVTLRAEFPNPGRWLLPGMFARARLEQAVNQEAITVPQRAVSRGAAGSASVLLVKGDNTVELRPIQIGSAVGNQWVVTSGLKAGERIIMEGLQKVGPGMAVKPVPFVPAPTASAGGNSRI